MGPQNPQKGGLAPFPHHSAAAPFEFFLKGARWGFNCLYCIFSRWFQICDQNLNFFCVFFFIAIWIFKMAIKKNMQKKFKFWSQIWNQREKIQYKQTNLFWIRASQRRYLVWSTIAMSQFLLGLLRTLMEIFSMQLEALSVFSYLNYLTKELLIHGNIFCFILFHNKVTRSNKSLEICHLVYS